MSLISNTIQINQLKNHNRWDSSFNLELKSLSNRKIELKTIEEISEHITNGATPFGAQFPSEGTNFYRANDVKRFNFDFFGHKYITKEQSKALKRSILEPNDIVFTIKGKVGDVAVFPKEQKESNINQDNALIRLKKEYDPFYFVAIFNSKFGLNQVKAFATETVNPFLGLGNLKKLKIPILKTNFMEDISDKVQISMKNNLDSLNKIKKAQSLYYQKLNIDFKKIEKKDFFPVKLSDFKEEDLWTPKYSYPLYVNILESIKEKWEIVSLGEIVDVNKGSEVGSDNYKKYLERIDTDIPFIRTSDLVNYEIDQFPDFYIPEEIYKELEQDIKSQDILFTKDGKIGMSAMITKSDKCIIASGISRIRLNEEAQKYNISPEYLFLVLSVNETGLYPALRRTVIASTIPHLREKRLKEIEIPILDKKSIQEITKLVKESFELKDKNKILIKKIIDEVDKEIG